MLPLRQLLNLKGSQHSLELGVASDGNEVARERSAGQICKKVRVIVTDLNPKILPYLVCHPNGEAQEVVVAG